jgi:hypothetical protein
MGEGSDEKTIENNLGQISKPYARGEVYGFQGGQILGMLDCI